jgi:ankyrin repeat protein
MFGKMWTKFHSGVFVDACKHGDIEQVRLMLEKEPELAYLKDKKGISALFHAVANGHASIVDTLLQITRQPDDVESEKGFTPLLIAATNGHMAIVRVLLEHGANPNLRNFDGVTALHNAVFEKQMDVVKLLLEHGANPTIQDRLGNTPINLARKSSNPNLTQLFK